MTGYSHNKEYTRKMVSFLLILGGAGLILEHLFRFEGFDLFDLVGHETYGLVMIGAGFILSLKWKQIPALLRAIKERRWHAVIDEGERY